MAVTVSVILPVYNRSHSLSTACESVLGQSFRDLELIVVDDASSQDLKKVVGALDDPRVRYIRHAINGGAAAARNTGLAAAEGHLIAFQDSDDMWLPGKLERQIALLDKMPAEVGVVTGGKILYGSNGAGAYGPGLVAFSPKPWRPRLSPEQDQVRHMLKENRISLQNALFRRDCFPEDAWFDTRARANNDWEFTIRLVQHTKVFEDIEPVTLAFSSSDSISTSARKKLTGHLLVLKKNRHLAVLYPDTYGFSQYVFGKGLWNIGKRNVGRRFMLHGLRNSPASVLGSLAQTAARRLVRNPLNRIGLSR